eukprot:scaffold7242_cov137-Cylindrotheca_fusiformis.AAC.2
MQRHIHSRSLRRTALTGKQGKANTWEKRLVSRITGSIRRPNHPFESRLHEIHGEKKLDDGGPVSMLLLPGGSPGYDLLPLPQLKNDINRGVGDADHNTFEENCKAIGLESVQKKIVQQILPFSFFDLIGKSKLSTETENLVGRRSYQEEDKTSPVQQTNMKMMKKQQKEKSEENTLAENQQQGQEMYPYPGTADVGNAFAEAAGPKEGFYMEADDA